MNKNEEKFRDYCSLVLKKDQRNRYLLGCANKAKYYELDKNQALEIIKEYFHGEFESADLTTWNKAWDKANPPKTYTDDLKDGMKFTVYVKKYKDTIKEVNKTQQEIEKEVAFANYIYSLSTKINLKDWAKNNKLNFKKTTDFMLNIFNENDIIWVSDSFISEDLFCEMKDVKSWVEKKEYLLKYQFYIINPF